MRHIIASVLLLALIVDGQASAKEYDTARVDRERIVDLIAEIREDEAFLAGFGSEEGYSSKGGCLSAWDLFPRLDRSTPEAYVRSLDSLGRVNPCFKTTPWTRKQLLMRRDELKQIEARLRKRGETMPAMSALARPIEERR